jgi:hypothetical protein
LTEAPGELVQELAPEVSAVEFRYFDGYTWYDYWTSTEAQPLPLAIEIAVSILPRTASESTDPLAIDPMAATVYRLVVQLPTAEIGEGTTADGTTTDGSTTDQSGQSSSGQSSSGSSTGSF